MAVGGFLALIAQEPEPYQVTFSKIKKVGHRADRFSAVPFGIVAGFLFGQLLFAPNCEKRIAKSTSTSEYAKECRKKYPN